MDITAKATRDDIWANILERLESLTRSESPSGTPPFGERLQRRRAASTAPGDEQIGADPDGGRVLPGYLGEAVGRHHREHVDAVVGEWASGLLGEKVARGQNDGRVGARTLACGPRVVDCIHDVIKQHEPTLSLFLETLFF